MRVSVAYALPNTQWWIDVDIHDGATAIAAIHQSGLLVMQPDIKLDQQKIGVFGRFITLETPLVDGDRVEIYRPITWVAPQDDEDEDDD